MLDELTQSALLAAFSVSEKKIVLCDASADIRLVSDALLDYCDLKLEDFAGKSFCIGSSSKDLSDSWLKAISNKQKDFFLSGIAALETDTQPFIGLNQFTVTPLKKADETIGYTIVLESDTNFENAIPESVWLQFFRNTEDGICLFDENLKVLARNDAFKNLCGYSATRIKTLDKLLEVHGPFKHWLLTAKNLSEQAQIVTTTPPRQVHISVTSFELFDQHLYWCYVRDISSTNALQKRLDQTSLRLRSLFENNNDGVVLTDLDGIYVDVNSRFAEMLDVSVQDVIGKHFTYFNAPGSNELPRFLSEKFYSTGRLRPFEKTLLTSRGVKINVEVQLLLHYDIAGRPIGAWNFIRPIEKERVKEIRNAYQYEKLFEQSLDAIIFTTIDGEIKLANDAFNKLLGRQSSDIVDHAQQSFTHPDDIDIESSLYRKQLMSRGYTDLYEKRYISADDKIIPVSVRNALVRGEDGNIQGVWSIARDESLRRKLIESLAASERRFRALFSNSIDAIALWTVDHELQYANKAYLDIIGYSHQEFRSLTYVDITPPGWEEVDALLEQQVAERGYSDIIEKEFLRKDGTVVPITIRASAMKDDDNNVIGSWVIVRDISEHKATMRKLEHSQNMLKQTTRMTRAGSWELNIKSGQYTFSEETYQILSLPRSYTTNILNVAKLFDEDAETKIFKMFNRFLEGKGTLEQDLCLSGFSPERWVRINAEVAFNERGERYAYGAIQDISDFKMHQKTLESDRDTFQQMAFHDPLTKLPNRLLMEDRFTQISNQARRLKSLVAVMIIDLDNFKIINDRYGHLAGDTLLSELANRLKNSIRASDTLARLGGDEFIVIATLENKDQAANLAQKMLNNVNSDLDWKETVISVSCSIGIATSDNYEMTFEELYALADGALYGTKEDGKDGFSFAR